MMNKRIRKKKHKQYKKLVRAEMTLAIIKYTSLSVLAASNNDIAKSRLYLFKAVHAKNDADTKIMSSPYIKRFKCGGIVRSNHG